jgi:hypothetical protein
VKEAFLTVGEAGKASFQCEVGRVLYYSLGKEALEDLLIRCDRPDQQRGHKRRRRSCATQF